MDLELGWSARLEEALRLDQFVLCFQPILPLRQVDCDSLPEQQGALWTRHLRRNLQQRAFYEALIRLRNPDGTLVAPSAFLPAAERFSLIGEIDRWVIRQSIARLAQSPHLPAMAVNISGRSFDDPDLPSFIDEQLREAGVAPQRLIVELTETSAVSDLRDAERFIGALRRTGCHVCLDDFGTGFASFAYLKHLKVDVLKIDGLFIRNLPHEHDNQVFVRSIIEVARGLGKRTVAEFVENEESLRMLQAFGVDMVQGYHLDKPQEMHPALTQPPAGAGGSHILQSSSRV